MRFAIFGDVHANLEALEAVLADARDMGVTHFACLGDVVGYNASPHECVARLRELGCPVVKGNHDHEASIDTEMIGINPRALAALKWTRWHLTDEDRAWLRGLPMVLQRFDFTLVHASLGAPERWAYVLNGFDALSGFDYQFTPVCFIGHTHLPRVYIQAATVTVEDFDTIRLEHGCKYLINVGSVGQPRDGDWRAAYAVYDYDQREVSLRRVPYDIEAARQKCREAGL
jgi:predicted phosphodiesterase